MGSSPSWQRCGRSCGSFEKEEKHEMVSLLKEEVTIGNRNEYLTNAIKIYTRSVFDALNDNDVSQIKFYRTNEL